MNEAAIFEFLRQLIIIYYTTAQIGNLTPEQAQDFWMSSWLEVKANPPDTLKDV